MLKLPIALGAALALHAAAAASVVVLGHPRAATAKPGVVTVGETIDVEPVATPIVHEDVRAPVVDAPRAERSSRGSPARARGVREAVAAPSATAVTSDEVAIPEPAPTETVAPVRFKMSLGARGAGASTASNEVAAESDVTERARQVGGTKPRYPAEAIARGVELGSPLAFEIVVDASGRVVQTRALRHAGYGFDEAAVAALRTYRFTPAKRNGRAVAVRMTWTVDFHFD